MYSFSLHKQFKKCRCSTLKKDDILENITDCESGCNFCKFHNIYDKYEIIRKIPYVKIRDIIGFTNIINDEKILFDIMKNKTDNISFKDLYEILGQKSLKNMNISCVNKICGVVKKNIIKSNKNNISIKILQKIINNESLLSTHYRTIMNFILVLHLFH